MTEPELKKDPGAHDGAAPPSPHDPAVAAAFAALKRQAGRIARRPVQRMEEQAPLSAAGVTLFQAPLLLDDRCWRALLRFAAAMHVSDLRAALFAGRLVNVTEERPALHWLARAEETGLAAAAGGLASAAARRDAALLAEGRARLRELVEDVRSGRWRGAGGAPFAAMIHLGIGGSHLGPEAAWEALAPLQPADGRLPVHFLSNMDGSSLDAVLSGLDPARTLVTVASKSFGTVETLALWRKVRAWLAGAAPEPEAQALAITAAPGRAAAAGFAPERTLVVPESIGGRFSLTSAFGAPIAFGLGWETFSRLLAGARAMDAHVREAPPPSNLPLRLALAGFWMKAVRRVEGEVVVPYADRLERFVDHLQQLDLESNGKRVAAADGRPLAWPGTSALWGRRGTNAQHAFFQMLHQGTRDLVVTMIGIRPGWSGHGDLDRALIAHLLGQSAAFFAGRSRAEVEAALEAAGHGGEELRRLAPHLVLPGARPHQILLLERLDPEGFGALLALFEHRTVIEGWLFGINPFDQWGVELGKERARAAEDLLRQAGGEAAELPPALVAFARAAGLVGRG
ncbi:MAG: glucose-6-phosphate isomerase [Rhodothalassiaceae bacterium]|nr:MAG: glucose-6-phosphate isomerase [Rhodothalassiaceae bacterium]